MLVFKPLAKTVGSRLAIGVFVAIRRVHARGVASRSLCRHRTLSGRNPVHVTFAALLEAAGPATASAQRACTCSGPARGAAGARGGTPFHRYRRSVSAV